MQSDSQQKALDYMQSVGMDSASPLGQQVLEMLQKVQASDRVERSRRAKVWREERRAKGLVTSCAPLGYKIKRIIPVGDQRSQSYYFPYPEERQFGELIVFLRDVRKLSYHQIAVKFWIEKIVKPRSGKSPSCRADVCTYYHRCKAGWPLPGGGEWKPPQFNYKLV